MRQAVIAVALALLAACDSSKDLPPVFGGFTPVDGTAVVFPPTTCNIFPLGNVSISGLGILQTDFAGACDYATAAQFCDGKASATLLFALAVSGVQGGGTAPAIGPGTYPFLTAPPASTSFATSLGLATRTDAVCAAVPPYPTDMNGGNVVITSIDATHATGTLDLRFEDGTDYAVPFDLPLCPPPADICRLITGGGCGTRACLP